jgi:hypothetical protein
MKPELANCAQAYVDLAGNTSMTGQRIEVGKFIE